MILLCSGRGVMASRHAAITTIAATTINRERSIARNTEVLCGRTFGTSVWQISDRLQGQASQPQLTRRSTRRAHGCGWCAVAPWRCRAVARYRYPFGSPGQNRLTSSSRAGELLDFFGGVPDDFGHLAPHRVVLGAPAHAVGRLHEPAHTAVDVGHRTAHGAVHGLAHALEDVLDHVLVLLEELASRIGDLVDLLALDVLSDHQAFVLQPLQRGVHGAGRGRIAAA